MPPGSFQNQILQWQFGGKTANSRGAGKGHRAPATEFEAELHERFGLHQAAAEGMRDSPFNLDTTQALQNLIDGPSRMEEHGQVEITRNLQLRDQKLLLPLRVKSWHEVVKTDFTDGNRRLFAQRFAFQPAAQRR